MIAFNIAFLNSNKYLGLIRACAVILRRKNLFSLIILSKKSSESAVKIWCFFLLDSAWITQHYTPRGWYNNVLSLVQESYRIKLEISTEKCTTMTYYKIQHTTHQRVLWSVLHWKVFFLQVFVNIPGIIPDTVSITAF